MKEQLLVNYIRNSLRGLEALGICRYIRNNTGARPWCKARAGGGEYRGYLRFGEPGSPDFLIFLRNGRTIHLEVKGDGGKLRNKQMQWQCDMERLGHTYVVVRTREEFDALLAEEEK